MFFVCEGLFAKKIVRELCERKMKLSARLNAVARLVPPVHTLADIGTDHGYIPIYLIQHKRIKRAIAADISAGSLDKARRLIREHGLEECVETRLGSGLSVLSPGEADIIIIAGMGGVLISDIINEGREAAIAADALILQPMTGQAELRRWLLNNGFDIADEDLAKEDRRIYEVIVAVPDPAASGYKNEIYYDIGWKLIEKKHPLLKEWIEGKMDHLAQIMRQLERGKSDSAAERLQQFRDKYRQYKEVYNCHIG